MSCITKCIAEDRLCENCLSELEGLRQVKAAVEDLAERWLNAGDGNMHLAGARLTEVLSLHA